MNDPKELVVAFRASSLSEAEIVRTVLEEAGLFAVIPNRNAPFPGSDMTPFDGEYTAAGCEVLVPVEELKQAQTVLAEARAAGRELEDEGTDPHGGASAP